jgi:hypothetical protein
MNYCKDDEHEFRVCRIYGKRKVPLREDMEPTETILEVIKEVPACIKCGVEKEVFENLKRYEMWKISKRAEERTIKFHFGEDNAKER